MIFNSFFGQQVNELLFIFFSTNQKRGLIVLLSVMSCVNYYWKSFLCVKFFLPVIFEQLRAVRLGCASFDNKSYHSGISFLRVPCCRILPDFDIYHILKRCDHGIFNTLSQSDLYRYGNDIFCLIFLTLMFWFSLCSW